MNWVYSQDITCVDFYYQKAADRKDLNEGSEGGSVG